NIPSVKLPFKLDFNKYVAGQKYDNLKKLNLHNEDRDPSMMRSKIISDFLIEQGVPAPRVAYTRNTINGEYWGLYTVVEQLDKTFLSTNFSLNSGNLYKALPRYPGWEPLGGSTLEYLGFLPSDYDDIYELKTNETLNDWSGFVNLLNEINNTSATEFKDSLEAVLNTDSFLKAWAIMALFVNYDAYPFLGNNYYLYENPVDGKFQWIAWDFNLGVGTARRGMTIPQAETVSVLFLPVGSGPRPLATRMLDNVYYYNRYLSWLCQFTQTSFDTTLLFPKIDSIADLIRTDLYADPNKFYGNLAFEESMDYNIFGFPGLKPFIAHRRAAVLEELETLGCPVVSVESATAQSIKVVVYPNPFSDFATIELQEPKDLWTWTLYNALGQTVQHFDEISGQRLIIEKGDLTSGIYFYQVWTKNRLAVAGKLAIE
ncbi:MAG: CotH kinase family protein, partial [Saprospiraceae bacterium]